ncbi:MAG: OadG family protein [Candidatus Borkfalkiaceae bacterium]|nr:OadG family protein [Clostridia bacterium]MDY6223070.1 OadG family protein [Christensenellaceae bacterium]
MFSNLLAEAFDPSLYNKKISPGEAAIDALLGFIIVFVGIAVLVFIVWAVGKLIQTTTVKKSADGVEKTAKTARTEKIAKTAKNAKKAESVAESEKTAQEELAAADVQTAAQEEIGEETVAVISAAIAAIYAGSGRNCGFVVRRIRRM